MSSSLPSCLVRGIWNSRPTPTISTIDPLPFYTLEKSSLEHFWGFLGTLVIRFVVRNSSLSYLFLLSVLTLFVS